MFIAPRGGDVRKKFLTNLCMLFLKKEDIMMRKLSLLSLPVLVCLMMVPALVEAQAVVIKDTSCTVLGVDKVGTFEVVNTTKVTTPSQNCNRNVSCHGDLSDQPSFVAPDKAVVFNHQNTDWVCLVNFDGVEVSTTSWHQVITPNGNVSLTCHFKDCVEGPPV